MIARAFSRQKEADLWQGDQVRWPVESSERYESRVVRPEVYSSRMPLRDLRSSRRSGSVRWRVWSILRTCGRRVWPAMGSKKSLFWAGENRFRSVERSKRVVFSFGERRMRSVYNWRSS